jgi:methionyl-tRNA synthetase
MKQSSQVNQYISHREPWNLIKQPSADCKQKAQITLYCCLEALRIIGLLLQPVIPQAADKLLFKLGVPSTERNWNCAQFTDYPGEREIPSAKLILFPRLSQL